MKAAILCILLAFVSVVFGSCSVSLTPVARHGSTWPVNNGAGIAGIYDITVTNTGDQNADRVYFDINLPSGVKIIQWWQFSRLPPTFMDLPSLAPGDTFTVAGFVVENPFNTHFPSVSLSYDSTVC